MFSAHSVARRGISAAHSFVTTRSEHSEVIEIPITAVLVFLLTGLAFFVLMFMVTYTYGHVIPALCIVESPETNVYVPVQNIGTADEPPAYAEEDDGLPKPDEPEILLAKNIPITSSIRQTVLHLRARAGYWSRFRGLSLFVIWSLLHSILTGIFSLGSRNFLVVSLGAIIAEVALAHIHMTWIHIVISEPSEKRWYKRIPSLRGNWIKIAPAVLLWSVVSHAVNIVPMLICGSFGALRHMQDPNFHPRRKDMYVTASQLFMAMILTVIMYIGLQIPATVTFVRVAASMLPEEDETIVPFDRTFGGKVTPIIVGGQGKIGLVEAWKSFTWESRRRLLLLCAKVAAILVSCWILFSIVIVTEAHLMFGEEGLGEIMKKLHGARGY